MIDINVTVPRNLPEPQMLPILAAAAQAVMREVRKNFLRREGEPNRMGWAKKHFWKREGFDKTTVALVTDEVAVVQVASVKIAHKLLGGTIRPGPGRKALAIPLTEEAYAAGSPRLKVINGLFHPKGTNFLATMNFGRDGAADELVLQYMLVKQVTQAPDPRTLPDAETLGAAAGKAAGAALRRQLAQAQTKEA